MPRTIEEAADDAYTFVRALGLELIDVFSFSMGGMIAQDLVLKHPELVRRLVLTGTGPRGGTDMDKVVPTTYLELIRSAFRRADVKEFLFFNRNETGKRAAKSFLARLQEETTTAWSRRRCPRTSIAASPAPSSSSTPTPGTVASSNTTRSSRRSPLRSCGSERHGRRGLW
ncbi:alpha/beta fold hydrolase [Leifsonia shinshuensis]|uniref:alpha/beta fold hydrolase n=1 Tax=Leifsonia shinshuensis TaxID=150026 RepID=UPI001F512A08|nr:alpha/beta hydrolase [Leifsonia shinshuensis]